MFSAQRSTVFQTIGPSSFYFYLRFCSSVTHLWVADSRLARFVPYVDVNPSHDAAPDLAEFIIRFISITGTGGISSRVQGLPQPSRCHAMRVEEKQDAPLRIRRGISRGRGARRSLGSRYPGSDAAPSRLVLTSRLPQIVLEPFLFPSQQEPPGLSPRKNQTSVNRKHASNKKKKNTSGKLRESYSPYYYVKGVPLHVIRNYTRPHKTFSFFFFINVRWPSFRRFFEDFS